MNRVRTIVHTVRPPLAARTACSLAGRRRLLRNEHEAGAAGPTGAAAHSRLRPGPTRTSRSHRDSQPVDVQVTKPTRRELIYTVTLPANISPLYQTTLYAKVSGYLKWIGPDKGDAVKKDQVLAIIDAPEVEEQYHQALSDYHIKKLTFERLAKVWKESPDVIAKQDVDVAEAAYPGSQTSGGAAGRAARLHQGPRALCRNHHGPFCRSRRADPDRHGLFGRSAFRSLRSWTSIRCASIRTCRRTIPPGWCPERPRPP